MKNLFIILISSLYLYADTKTANLQWEGYVSISEESRTWYEAKDYCKQIDYTGLWRLPTIKELFEVMLSTREKPERKMEFFSKHPQLFNFWTSNTSAANNKYAWKIYNNNTIVTTLPKSSKAFTICVKKENK